MKDKSSPRHYYEAYSHIEDEKHLHFSKDNWGTLGQVELYLSVDPSLKTDRIAYMRKPLMLVEETSNKTHHGVYALFLCRDENGNVALSGLEDASHSSWSHKGKRGDALIQAKKVLSDIGGFVKACLDEQFDIQGDTAAINIGFGYSEKDIESLLADKSESNNPFGSISGDKITIKADKTSEDSGSEKNPTKGNLGKEAKGERNVNRAGTKTIGLGHTKKKSKKKGGDSTGGRNRTKGSPTEGESGQPFTLYSPIEYRAPAYEKNGEWFHDLIMHVEEDMDKVFIEVKIGTDDGDDSIRIIQCGAVGRISKKGTGIIEFDHLRKGVVKLQIQFNDKMRHAISLK